MGVVTREATVREVESYDTNIEAGPTDSVGAVINGQFSENTFTPQIIHISEFHCSVSLNLLLSYLLFLLYFLPLTMEFVQKSPLTLFSFSTFPLEILWLWISVIVVGSEIFISISYPFPNTCLISLDYRPLHLAASQVNYSQLPRRAQIIYPYSSILLSSCQLSTANCTGLKPWDYCIPTLTILLTSY